MYTVKEYMQTVTAVDPYWLAEREAEDDLVITVGPSMQAWRQLPEARPHVLFRQGIQSSAHRFAGVYRPKPKHS